MVIALINQSIKGRIFLKRRCPFVGNVLLVAKFCQLAQFKSQIINCVVADVHVHVYRLSAEICQQVLQYTLTHMHFLTEY